MTTTTAKTSTKAAESQPLIKVDNQIARAAKPIVYTTVASMVRMEESDCFMTSASFLYSNLGKNVLSIIPVKAHVAFIS